MTMRITIALALAMLAIVPWRPMAATAPPFELPKPTGSSAVGTTSWTVVDEARSESFADGKRKRQVKVVAWYPADSPQHGATSPYLREGLAEVQTFATLFRTPGAFDVLAEVQTHAVLDASPAKTPARFPVLLFSHGYTAIPSTHTALLEDLASHGYGALSIVHPYEATAALLRDGSTVTMLDEGGGIRQGIRDVLGEWQPEDKTMAEVTSSSDRIEQTKVLRGYLAKLPNTHRVLERWVADTRLVLDGLSSLPGASPAGRLASRLDLERVGVFGHSMGGVTAGQFCVEDRRCRAGLNLDGIPQYGSMIDQPLGRPFLMVHSARPGRTGASDPIYQTANPYVRVDVRDTLHLDFTDMVFWGSLFGERRAKILGALAPARVTDITRAVVLQYFDQELRGRKSPLLAGTQSFPEVTVIRPPG
jgi:predicted dienelactone hydrolase